MPTSPMLKESSLIIWRPYKCFTWGACLVKYLSSLPSGLSSSQCFYTINQGQVPAGTDERYWPFSGRKDITHQKNYKLWQIYNSRNQKNVSLGMHMKDQRIEERELRKKILQQNGKN